METRFLILFLVPLSFAATIGLRGPLGRANEERRRCELRYTPVPGLMKVVAGAHRSTVADWFWLNALPNIAPSFPAPSQERLSPVERDKLEQERKAARKRWLDGVFAAVTSLDPAFTTVYRYGATFLGFLEEDHQAAIDLLELGVHNNPDDLLLRLDVAWSHYQYRKDRNKAIEHLEVAARNPGCDAFILRLLSWFRVNERDDVPAILQWTEWLESPNKAVRDKAEWCLGKTRLEIASRAIGEFEKKTGHKPSSIAELRGKGLIDSEVENVVLLSMELIDGRPRLGRYDELHRARSVDIVERWARLYREENGRWPTMQEIESSRMVTLPRAPERMRYELVDGRLVLKSR